MNEAMYLIVSDGAVAPDFSADDRKMDLAKEGGVAENDMPDQSRNSEARRRRA